MSALPRKAVVVGGSIAGLFAALMLIRRGWSVRVFERAGEALSGRGAGIVTHPELWRMLQAVGLDPANALGVWVEQRVVLGADGAEVARFACSQMMTAWERLWRMLRGALPEGIYVAGAEFVGAESGNSEVVARFADGSRAAGEVLIGADGIRSAVRDAIVGEVPPDYAGYVAWRGLVAESAVDEALFPLFAFCLPPGEQMLGYPVAGRDNDLRPGRRRYNWVWYRPADETAELPRLLTDAQGRTHAVSIPPPLIRPELIADLRARAQAVLAPALASVVTATAMPLLQPIYDLQSPRLSAGRVALVGDAAFVARPHVGAGTTKAAEDAAALAAALDEGDVPAALRRYEAERRPAGERFLRRARHLGGYLQARPDRETAARHASAAAVLAETAVLTF